MYNTILIPIDGSEASTAALDHGIAIADAHDATAHLLYVINVGTQVAASGMITGELTETLTEKGQEVLSAATTRAEEADVAYEQELLEGVPEETIAEYATDQEVDLIAMGTTGNSGVVGRRLGSTTNQILRRSDAPVLIAPETASVDNNGTRYSHVLTPTDGSENAERAAPYGADIAQHHSATLHIVSVVDVQSEAGAFSAGGVSEDFIEQLEEQGHESVNQFAERIDQTDADADLRKTVVQGTPHDALGEYVGENDIDLVVIASHGKSHLTGQLLGSVADRVIRGIDKPMLVVPTPE